MINDSINILIIGSGAIGIGLGASLLSQNVNVSFFSRKNTAKAMEKFGIKRTGIFENIKVTSDKFKVYHSYKTIPVDTFDFVLICTKTSVNKKISIKLNENKRILKENAKIIIFQNGFGNDEEYLKYFDENQVYCARVITGFKRPEMHISEITVHTQPILLGSLHNCPSSNVSIISEMINDSGIPSETTEDLSMYLWDKMLYNCTLNPLGAILGVNYGKLTENDYSIEIMNSIIDEIFDVLNASGFKSNWDTPEDYKEIFYSKLVPDTYNHESSTLQDIKKRQKTEIDTLTGKIIELAEEYNINVPVNKVIYNQIKALESDF